MLVIIRRTINIWTRIVKVWVELILYECGNNLIQRITFLICYCLEFAIFLIIISCPAEYLQVVIILV